MSCQVNFPLQDIVLLLREKISPEIIGAVPEEKLEEEVLVFIQPKLDELQEQLSKLPPEVHIVTQILEDTSLKTTLNNGKVLTSDFSPLFARYDGLLSLYNKNVKAGAGANGWDTGLVIEGEFTQKQINEAQKQINEVQKAKNKELVTPFDFGAIGDGVYHKLSEKYTTLTDAQVKYPTAQSLDDSIDLCALEAFFKYCKDNMVVSANATVYAYVNRPLVLLGEHKTIYWGNLKLCNTQEVDEIPYLMFLNSYQFLFRGRMTFIGTPNSNVATRKQLSGLRVGDGKTDGSGGRADIDALHFYGFRDEGLDIQNNAIFFTCGYIWSGRIGASKGSGSGASISHSATITNRDDGGKLFSFEQRSVLTVSSMPPNKQGKSGFISPTFIRHDGEIYFVASADYELGTISVYPCLNFNSTVTQIDYIYGTAVSYVGNNSGCGKFGHIQSILCGVGYLAGALYGATIDYLVTEGCGVGLLAKPKLSELSISHTISNSYYEGNMFDICYRNGGAEYSGISILNTHGLSWNKCVDLYSYRVSIYDTSTGGRRSPINFGSLSIVDKGVLNSVNDNANIGGVDISRGGHVRYITNGSNTITVDWNFCARLGVSRRILVIAPSTNPTVFTSTQATLSGDTTIPPSTRHTVVGLSIDPISKSMSLLADKQTTVPLATKGTTAQRPANPQIGMRHYDTTLLASGKPIEFNGTNWVDSMGVNV